MRNRRPSRTGSVASGRSARVCIDDLETLVNTTSHTSHINKTAHITHHINLLRRSLLRRRSITLLIMRGNRLHTSLDVSNLLNNNSRPLRQFKKWYLLQKTRSRSRALFIIRARH